MPSTILCGTNSTLSPPSYGEMAISRWSSTQSPCRGRPLPSKYSPWTGRKGFYSTRFTHGNMRQLPDPKPSQVCCNTVLPSKYSWTMRPLLGFSSIQFSLSSLTLISNYPIYLIRVIAVGYIILVSTMEEEIAEIQQLYDRIPQQLIAELTTYLEDYALPAQQLQLQSSFDEDALNSLVAGLLEREDLPRFQFLVEGGLLRGELKSHILRHELTAEQTLHIEYVVSFPNLNAHKQKKEEDWVASIAVLPGPDTNIALAAALYNGSIAFYDLSLKQLGKVKVDQDPLKSTAVMIGSQEGSYFCLSGGMGELLKIHLVDARETFKTSPISSNVHHGSINIIAVSPGPDNHFATAGSQGELSIWQIPQGFEQLGSHNAVKSKKKKKEVNLNVLPLLASAQVSQGSIECAGWLNNEEVVTGSSQHRMTLTNITRMAASETFLTRDSVVSSLDCTDTLILSAHEDGQIRLWDRRVSSKPSSTFKAHSKWASSVRFNPRLPHLFCSGSHDRTLKLWDARCGFPLQNIQAEQEKVLATEWAGEQQVVSGGSDAKLHLHSAR